ncbi:hypothetical protein Pla108_17420 [Botrimarina colliarenosi]|uniref:Methanolan biosynthesis EpsI domain-containing protein n=1 Tax=Botrimarina colliarenosi TaxID=2528001 RepID=A0A5C6ADU8_9BACT|nr:hypothetical protein [Botrimarina colliarenosi]TWT97590.1 hypothetical protein Pla108_17420 [Botrimarina colliarenosi]
MKGLLSIVVAVGLTVAAAVVHGNYLHRWGAPVDLSAAGGSIDRLDESLGPWHALEDGTPLTSFVSRELGLVNHLNRWFENAETGRRLQLLLMVGQPGPLVRHPPTVCYANRAHEQVAPAKLLAIPYKDAINEFALLSYKPSRAHDTERFFVAYGHSVGGEWGAPDFPRIAYGSSPALYKVQVLANRLGDETEQVVIEDIRSFLSGFVASFAEDVAIGANQAP